MHVVKNRVAHKRFPKDYCSVVKQKRPSYQFEWYYFLRNSIPKDVLLWAVWVLDVFRPDPIEVNALRISFIQAYDFYITQPEDITNGSIYFFSLWFFNHGAKDIVKSYAVSDIIGGQVFFNHIIWR
jgi:hypothetical protein